METKSDSNPAIYVCLCYIKYEQLTNIYIHYTLYILIFFYKKWTRCVNTLSLVANSFWRTLFSSNFLCHLYSRSLPNRKVIKKHYYHTTGKRWCQRLFCHQWLIAFREVSFLAISCVTFTADHCISGRWSNFVWHALALGCHDGLLINPIRWDENRMLARIDFQQNTRFVLSYVTQEKTHEKFVLPKFPHKKCLHQGSTPLNENYKVLPINI